MIHLPDRTTVYFDVDDTLVMHVAPSEDEGTLQISGLWVTPHAKHLERVIEHKKKGHTVVVWSGGGSDWAAQVVKALGVEAYVDVCVSKPNYYYDDLQDPRYFLGQHVYCGALPKK